jgi:hypothetical protein
VNFSPNRGSFESLKVRIRWGVSPCAFQMRWTLTTPMPQSLAMARPVQCVVSPGGSAKVSSTTWATVPAGSGALPGLRVLSRSSPSTPSRMKRSCQRHTAGFESPERRMTSFVPRPSAVAISAWARATCF